MHQEGSSRKEQYVSRKQYDNEDDFFTNRSSWRLSVSVLKQHYAPTDLKHQKQVVFFSFSQYLIVLLYDFRLQDKHLDQSGGNAMERIISKVDLSSHVEGFSLFKYIKMYSSCT